MFMLLEKLHAGVVLVFNRVFVILTFAFIRVLMLVVLTPPPKKHTVAHQ